MKKEVALRSLAIEVTTRCNMRCSMCVSHGAGLYQGQADGHPAFIDDNLFKSLAEQFAAMSSSEPKMITPQFQGEPLLHPRFIELCEYLEQLKLRFHFTTNAQLLTPSLSRELLKLRSFRSINFSIDGITKETYEGIRIGAHFEEVMSNVESFLAMAKAHRTNSVKIGINFTVQPLNEHESKAFIRTWVKKGISVCMNNLAVNGRPVKIHWAPRRFPCPDLFTSMIVLTNGQVVPCCRDYLYRFRMGNLQEKSLHEIWLGETYQQMREAHLCKKWGQFPLCADCDTWMSHCRIRTNQIRLLWPGILMYRGPITTSARAMGPCIQELFSSTLSRVFAV